MLRSIFFVLCAEYRGPPLFSVIWMSFLHFPSEFDLEFDGGLLGVHWSDDMKDRRMVVDRFDYLYISLSNMNRFTSFH